MLQESRLLILTAEINQSSHGEAGECSKLVGLLLQLVVTRHDLSVWSLWFSFMSDHVGKCWLGLAPVEHPLKSQIIQCSALRLLD